MPRSGLDNEIFILKNEVLILGSMVEQSMISAVTALKKGDLLSAHTIYNSDKEINDKRYALENAIIILIATQQPMAHDLRILAAILEVAGELERMGDYAKGICKIMLKLGAVTPPIKMDDIEKMANKATDMLHRALGAFVDEDSSLANAIPMEDDEVDALYATVYEALISAMTHDTKKISQTTRYLWVAHNLERMADRVTNICERTVFIATGDLMEIDSSDDEETL
nr:phosphate signaling complex protein PhoU [Anaerolineaceae bacterium]